MLSQNIVPLSAGILALLLGSILLWQGVRGWRIGEDYYCVKCGYNLTDVTSDVCPECGIGKVSADVIRGKYQRHRSFLVAGGMAAICGLMCLTVLIATTVPPWQVHAIRSGQMQFGHLMSFLEQRMDRGRRAIEYTLAYGDSEPEPNGMLLPWTQMNPDRLEQVFLELQQRVRSAPFSTSVKDSVVGHIDDAVALIRSEIRPRYEKPLASMTSLDRKALISCLDRLQQHYDQLKFDLRRGIDGLSQSGSP
jgi:hypothetical protein